MRRLVCTPIRSASVLRLIPTTTISIASRLVAAIPTYLPRLRFRGDLDDDFDFSLDDVLDGLGEQEKVQVYTNIQGGVGHFMVFSSQEIDMQLSDNQ